MSEHTHFTAMPRDLVQSEVPPSETREMHDGALFVDFGRAAFGTLVLPPCPAGRPGPLVVHLGEKLGEDGRIDRAPPGTIRYRRIEQDRPDPAAPCRVVIPPDERNTGPAAIRMPPHIGEVLPFRYAEIEQAGGCDPAAVRQLAAHYPFNDDASSFESADEVLNAVWDLCKHTIKATTFCGVYVDGDRERIPYEADAYINQLGHYAVDAEYEFARYTHEYLIQHPTWPTEWHMHSVLMAWQDYMYTGETRSLETFYDDLAAKTLIGLAGPDVLISTESEACTRAYKETLHLYHSRYLWRGGLKDLVDWPPGSYTDGGEGERDGHEMRPVNTVVNAFHAHALQVMSRIANVLGREADRARFAAQAQRVRDALNSRLFDEARGVYVDGEGTDHASLHSSMFPLAFGLVPQERLARVLAFVKSRGMACSVYGAQYLLDGLYRHGEADYAFGLLTARHDRSWWNMIASGSTMTMEAWDLKYKLNLDWNHAWGAAPANLVPRRLMGIRPMEPGFRKILVQPRPGPLAAATILHPTRLGPVRVSFEQSPKAGFALDIEVPPGSTACIALPRPPGAGDEVCLDGRPRRGEPSPGFIAIDGVTPGRHSLQI